MSRAQPEAQHSGRRSQRLIWIAFGVAIIMALFVIPRPETPNAVPLPPLDWRIFEQSERDRRARVARTMTQPLSVEIRGIGERVRRCGVLERDLTQAREGALEALLQERSVLRKAVGSVVRAGRSEELLALRDLQSELLLQAMQSGAQEADRDELGGRLEHHVRTAGTLLLGSELRHATLHALFARRWAQLVGLEKHPAFRPTANEQRLMQRFRVRRLLEQPLANVSGELLAVLERTREFSPDFPVDYARGIVLYRTGAFGDALHAFGRHLQAHPEGRFALRARNFRLSAAAALVH